MPHKSLIIALLIFAAILGFFFSLPYVQKMRLVDEQEQPNTIVVAISQDAQAKEMQFREQETQAGAIIIAAGQKGQKVGTTPVFAAPLEIAQQNNPYGNNPVFGLRTSLSIQLSDGTWQTLGQEPDNPRTPAHTIGDIVEIDGKKYQVNFLWRIEGENGWVSLLLVTGPEPDLAALAPLEIHVRKRNATEILLGPREQWDGILVELKDSFITEGGDWELKATIAGDGGLQAEIKDTARDLKTSQYGETVRAQYARYLFLAERNALFQMLIDQNAVSIQPQEEQVFISEVQVLREVKISNSQGESETLKFGLKPEPPALDAIWTTLVRTVLATQ